MEGVHGTTVLGGDDKSGCAVIIEVIRSLQEQKIPHAPIEAMHRVHKRHFDMQPRLRHGADIGPKLRNDRLLAFIEHEEHLGDEYP